MSRKTTKVGVQVIVIAIVGVIFVCLTIGSALVEAKLVWIIPVLILVAGAAIWYFVNKQAQLQQEAEERRVENILFQQDYLGKEMCQWLIEQGHDVRDKRIAEILKQIKNWGDETCQALIQKEIGIGMTDEMIRLSLGAPTNIDNKEISTNSIKFRWVYGIPRKGATYIWFKDGVVKKIKH